MTLRTEGALEPAKGNKEIGPADWKWKWKLVLLEMEQVNSAACKFRQKRPAPKEAKKTGKKRMKYSEN